eukprot:6584532-Pyramimonas_sp.AAC.1
MESEPFPPWPDEHPFQSIPTATLVLGGRLSRESPRRGPARVCSNGVKSTGGAVGDEDQYLALAPRRHI